MKEKLLGQSEKHRFFVKKCLAVYSDALAQEAQCIETRAKILSNRALVHLWVKNYGKCIEDCLQAIQLDTKFTRPYARAAEAMLGLGLYEKAIRMADEGLKLEFIKELKDIRDEAIQKHDKETEILKSKQIKKKDADYQIITACAKNGILLGGPSDFPLPQVYNVEKIDN